MNGMSGGAPAQNVASYSARPHIRNSIARPSALGIAAFTRYRSLRLADVMS